MVSLKYFTRHTTCNIQHTCPMYTSSEKVEKLMYIGALYLGDLILRLVLDWNRDFELDSDVPINF